MRPEPEEEESNCSVAGGSWADTQSWVRVKMKDSVEPWRGDDLVGFRLVRVVGPLARLSEVAGVNDE